jgi:hypothetical protein
MLIYEYINRGWIISRTARRVYRVSACVSVALFFGFLAVTLEGGSSEAIAPVARLLLFPGALGAGITVVGMEYFFFRFDDSHALKQAFWFCVMLLPVLGPALYCFFVYSRSHILSGNGKHAKSASAGAQP